MTDDDNSEPSSEDVLDKEVSQVEKVLTSLGNDQMADVGNSVIEAQGKVQCFILDCNFLGSCCFYYN